MKCSRFKEQALKWIEFLKKKLDTRRVIEDQLRMEGQVLLGPGCEIDLSGSEVHILSVGKAACSMAESLASLLESSGLNYSGLVVTKTGHREDLPGFEILEAAHPVPDESSKKAANRVVEYLEGLNQDSILLVCLSGGGSALLSLPPVGLSLEDQQFTTKVLLDSGEPIENINLLRKCLSRVKGGRLASIQPGLKTQVFVISDVIGNDLSSISSGPFYGVPPRKEQAFEFANSKGLLKKLPEQVQEFLLSPGVEEIQNQAVPHCILSDCSIALKLSIEFFTGFDGELIQLNGLQEGLTEELVQSFLDQLQMKVERPVMILSGGESTVKIKGPGKGGRNQQFVLEMCRALIHSGHKDFLVCSYGTDGTDGPTDAAGGVLTGEDFIHVEMSDLEQAIERNDAYPFLKKHNGLLMTGPTGTNVNDVMFLAVF